jgi:hypothetical protein
MNPTPILSPNQEQAIQLLKKAGVPEDAARTVVKALPAKCKHMNPDEMCKFALGGMAAAIVSKNKH